MQPAVPRADPVAGACWLLSQGSVAVAPTVVFVSLGAATWPSALLLLFS